MKYTIVPTTIRAAIKNPSCFKSKLFVASFYQGIGILVASTSPTLYFFMISLALLVWPQNRETMIPVSLKSLVASLPALLLSTTGPPG